LGDFVESGKIDSGVFWAGREMFVCDGNQDQDHDDQIEREGWAGLLFLCADLAATGEFAGAGAGCYWVQGMLWNAGWRWNDSREVEACRILFFCRNDGKRRRLFGDGKGCMVM
jgi:hypothetical protein